MQFVGVSKDIWSFLAIGFNCLYLLCSFTGSRIGNVGWCGRMPAWFPNAWTIVDFYLPAIALGCTAVAVAIWVQESRKETVRLRCPTCLHLATAISGAAALVWFVVYLLLVMAAS